jgi:L,D-transpeptidase YcbB
MRKLLSVIFVLISLSAIVSTFWSCKGWLEDKSNVDSSLVRRLITDDFIRRPYHAAWDSAIVNYYANGGELLWLSARGTQRRHTLLKWLKQLNKHGVNPKRIGLEQIYSTERRLHTNDTLDAFRRNLDYARLEYLFTRSYLRYVCGMNYGFVNPAPIYNKLYEDTSMYPDTVPPPPDRKKKMFHLFVMSLQRPTCRFALSIIDSLKNNAERVFEKYQPRTEYYHMLQSELALQRQRHDASKVSCVKANLERARWKFRQPFGRKYVYVNTAAYMLKAVDMKRDTLFEMKVCCGSFKHKTPLMTSQLSYFELNPTWIVPPKIVHKEMIPAFARDSNFFDRNHLRVYNSLGHQLNARSIDWSKYANRGIPFKIKQDSGEGSDLGRIIFRFPNPFSVYLHDTPARRTFGHADRSVSHGCIRLERPLDLAYFLLDYPKEEKMDYIRLSIDQEAKTDFGKELVKTGQYKKRRFFGFSQRVPLFIDYRTLYLSAGGSLVYCYDHYGYDRPLLSALRHMKF